MSTQTQLATVEFTFQEAIPLAAIGDIIFAYIQGTDPDTIPAIHFKITGIKTVGMSYRQIICAELEPGS